MNINARKKSALALLSLTGASFATESPALAIGSGQAGAGVQTSVSVDHLFALNEALAAGVGTSVGYGGGTWSTPLTLTDAPASLKDWRDGTLSVTPLMHLGLHVPVQVKLSPQWSLFGSAGVQFSQFKAKLDMPTQTLKDDLHASIQKMQDVQKRLTHWTPGLNLKAGVAYALNSQTSMGVMYTYTAYRPLSLLKDNALLAMQVRPRSHGVMAFVRYNFNNNASTGVGTNVMVSTGSSWTKASARFTDTARQNQKDALQQVVGKEAEAARVQQQNQQPQENKSSFVDAVEDVESSFVDDFEGVESGQLNPRVSNNSVQKSSVVMGMFNDIFNAEIRSNHSSRF